MLPRGRRADVVLRPDRVTDEEWLVPRPFADFVRGLEVSCFDNLRLEDDISCGVYSRALSRRALTAWSGARRAPE
jgi:hypothetical protein